MLERERKLEIIDFTVTIVLFIFGCVIGKIVMVYVAETWLAFNGPGLSILGIGELIWWRLRIIIKKHMEDKED